MGAVVVDAARAVPVVPEVAELTGAGTLPTFDRATGAGMTMIDPRA